MRSIKSEPTQASENLALPLFPDFKSGSGKKLRTYNRVQEAIWTENKAHFIQQYLKYFVQVTKHGAYIDGFAGPQSFDKPHAWSAALVLQSEPKWLRKFFLCEITRRGVKALRALATAEEVSSDLRGRKVVRRICVYPGDFNSNVTKVLRRRNVTQKEATFCLLDQRTFECHWSTLKKLATYKKAPNKKIELLYFLGVGWIHRALSGIRRGSKARLWWGNADWKDLKKKSTFEIVELVRSRLTTELGYVHVAAYPVFDREQGNRVMYYMIHASDHDEAPALMVRAHHKAVRALPSAIQTDFRF